MSRGSPHPGAAGHLETASGPDSLARIAGRPMLASASATPSAQIDQPVVPITENLPARRRIGLDRPCVPMRAHFPGANFLPGCEQAVASIACQQQSAGSHRRSARTAATRQACRPSGMTRRPAGSRQDLEPAGTGRGGPKRRCAQSRKMHSGGTAASLRPAAPGQTRARRPLPPSQHELPGCNGRSRPHAWERCGSLRAA